MAPDLSYYGHYTIEDLFDGACQAFEVSQMALQAGDMETFREAHERHKKFSVALQMMRERAAQKYLQ